MMDSARQCYQPAIDYFLRRVQCEDQIRDLMEFSRICTIFDPRKVRFLDLEVICRNVVDLSEYPRFSCYRDKLIAEAAFYKTACIGVDQQIDAWEWWKQQQSVVRGNDAAVDMGRLVAAVFAPL